MTENNFEIEPLEPEQYLINNRFRVIRTIGSGGMGEILLAEDLKLRRQVAIKSIRKGSVSDPESRMRFLREAQTASQLEHTNICPIYEIYEEESDHYIVMQYIDGVTIDTIVRYKELSLQKILDIGIQICEGMSEAHGKGIIHRDLKPGNIIVDKKGVVKILDFGLAKFREGPDPLRTGLINSNLTEKGIVMGTVAYMSPEQARGEELDNRSDLFSFGILLYELIERKNPFYDKEQINTLYNVINKEVEFPEKMIPPFADLLLVLLNKKRPERPPGFPEVREKLIRIREELKGKKEASEEGGETEIIDLTEKEEILEEIRKTSDNENLGELVYKIKKIKAKTIPVVTTRKNYMKKASIIFAVLLMGLSAFFFLRDKGGLSFSGESGIFYINVQELEGDVPDTVKEGAGLLIRESLNQFDAFDTVTPETIEAVTRSGRNGGDLNEIKKAYRIFYDLSGTITRIGDIYNFDIVISSTDKKNKYSMTIPGLEGEDSILKHQIDTLSRRIYSKIFSEKKEAVEIRPVSGTYGTDWSDFENFISGKKHFEKYEYLSAEKKFSSGEESPSDKYFLSNIYYFRGQRGLARQKIAEILPSLDHLAESIRLKTRALEARLEFRFEKEIEFLQKLRERNVLSKDTLYEIGEAYFHHGNAEKASVFYRQALELDNEFSSALNHLGYCHSYLGEHEKAIEIFEEYRNLDNSANSFDSLGDGYFFSGELISAEASKRAAVAKDREGVYWAYLTLSDIALLGARFADAEQAVREYITVAGEGKNRADAYAKLAFIEFSKKNYRSSLEWIDRSLNVFDSDNISSNSSEARWLRGLINLALNDTAGCMKDLEWIKKIVKKYNLDEENFSAPYKYYLHLNALMLEKEGRTGEAEENFKTLIRMRSQLNYWITVFNYQFFHNEYALFLLRNGKASECAAEIDKCLEYSGEYIPGLWTKALLLEAASSPEAGSYYRKIDGLYGENREKNILTLQLENKLKALRSPAKRTL